MAESSSIDAAPHNGDAQVHEPRARKPTRIDFLRPRLSDETIRATGQINGNASGTSRCVSNATETSQFFGLAGQREYAY
jgi:sterol O-acyltransferase